MPGLRTALPAITLLFAAPAAAEWTPPSRFCHAGAYAMSDGSRLILTPSDDPNLRYRFESGRSGRLYHDGENHYVSGHGWAAREPVELEARTGECGEDWLRLTYTDGTALQGEKIALPAYPVTAMSGEAHLYGELAMPADASPAAVVVLQYGSGPDSAIAYNYLQHFLPLHGIAVLVFDKRGTGRSTGAFTADIVTMAHDMAAMVDALPDRVDGIPVGVMGESQGGWVAPLAAGYTETDFVVVSYGLTVSMQEEDRMEVAQSLEAAGYGPDVLMLGEQMHQAVMRVANSRFEDGMEELAALKAQYRGEAWFDALGGDITSLLTSTPDAEMDALRQMLDFPYDLTYDPRPALEAIDVPLLWVLGDADTEAPPESTRQMLLELQADGIPVDMAVFPDAEHGIIAVETDAAGQPRMGSGYADGYLDLLVDWIGDRELSAPHGRSGIFTYPRHRE